MVCRVRWRLVAACPDFSIDYEPIDISRSPNRKRKLRSLKHCDYGAIRTAAKFVGECWLFRIVITLRRPNHVGCRWQTSSCRVPAGHPARCGPAALAALPRHRRQFSDTRAVFQIAESIYHDLRHRRASGQRGFAVEFLTIDCTR